MSNQIIKGMGFHHIALKSADQQKSLEFYTALGCREVLRWSKGENDIIMLDLGDDGRIELFADGGDEYSSNGKWLHFALRVEDVEAAYQTALQAGGVPMTAPKTVPLESTPYRTAIQVAFVKGPDGEEVEFFKEIRD